LGIDVERLHDLPHVFNVARRNFTAAELQMLAGLYGNARRDGFFALWTRKEAVIKAMGASLAPSLKRIEFEPDPVGDPRLAALDGERSRTRDWVVLGLDLGRGYVAALATVHPLCDLQHFIWNDAVPVAAPAARQLLHRT